MIFISETFLFIVTESLRILFENITHGLLVVSWTPTHAPPLFS